MTLWTGTPLVSLLLLIISSIIIIVETSASNGEPETDRFQSVNVENFGSSSRGDVYGTESVHMESRLLVRLGHHLECFGTDETQIGRNTCLLDFVAGGPVSPMIDHNLILLENSYHLPSSYRFEDFFWTGSGDGEDDNTDRSDKPPTVYKTTTVVSTIYVDTPTTSLNGSDTTKCSIDCTTSIPSGEITPTPPTNEETTTSVEEDDDFFDADRQFWLLTVLKSDGRDPVIVDLKNSLARLYKTAFQRQQERHLGITRKKRNVDNKNKNVKVYIHDLKRTDGNDNIQVLYHVAMAGKPVAAITAAEDMTLVSDDEVRSELGYTFLIKAEPYLKPAEMQSLSKINNTWVFIGVSIAALLVVLLLIAFLTLALTKQKRTPSSSTTTGMANRRQIFERGVDNGAFVPDIAPKNESPTYINFRNQPSNQTIRSDKAAGTRPHSSSPSITSSSTTSLDISPLMGAKKKPPPKKPPRPKAAVSKALHVKRIAPELFDSDSSDISNKRDSPDFAQGVVSPKSYLSMPSVRSFPRGTMPEPLSKVLEPVSVLHLDMPEDEEAGSRMTPGLMRHGSVGAVEDPGVIGPIVWNMHRKRLQHGVSVDEGINDLNGASNVSRMRKRFHELLDDTFSLFGGTSRRGSPVPPDSRALPIEVKSHSAVNRANEDLQGTARTRPKTTDPRRKSAGALSTDGGAPRGAWTSTAPSPLIRPLSAGPTPRINTDLVLAEGAFKPHDPAVSLIATIKSEIERCSLPGSTTDLHK